MPTEWDLPTVSVLVLTAVVVTLLLAGVAKADAASRSDAAPGRRLLPYAAAVVALWLVFTARMALTGKLLDFNAMPPPATRVLVPGLVLASVTAFSPLGARMIRHLGFASLVGFHAFRLPLELLLHAFYAQGKLPVQMTYAGRNFDILTGIGAMVVAGLVVKGVAGRKTVLAFSLAGFALLLNIMVIAILSLPGPLRRFANDPPNELVLHFPYVFIPAVFVVAAFAGHLLLFRKLFRER